VCLLTLGFFTLAPIRSATKSNTKFVEGKVSNIYETGVRDLNIELNNDEAVYYINRGLDQGLILDSLTIDLIGKTVNIGYVKQFSLLDPRNQIRHIAMLTHSGKIVFTEIE
jgi:hypothetical protein